MQDCCVLFGISVSTCFTCSAYMYVFMCNRAKHPIKVHVWAGISYRGCTGICVSRRHPLYLVILSKTFPFFMMHIQMGIHLCRIKIQSILLKEHGNSGRTTIWLEDPPPPPPPPPKNLQMQLRNMYHVK